MLDFTIIKENKLLPIALPYFIVAHYIKTDVKSIEVICMSYQTWYQTLTNF